MKAIALNRTLKAFGDEASSTDLMISVIAAELAGRGIELTAECSAALPG